MPKSHPPYEQSPSQSVQRVSSAILCCLEKMNAAMHELYVSLLMWCHYCLHTIYSLLNWRNTYTKYRKTQTRAEDRYSVLPFLVLGCYMLTENGPGLKSWVKGWLGLGGKFCLRRRVERQNQGSSSVCGPWTSPRESLKFRESAQGVPQRLLSLFQSQQHCFHCPISWVSGCDFISTKTNVFSIISYKNQVLRNCGLMEVSKFTDVRGMFRELCKGTSGKRRAHG